MKRPKPQQTLGLRLVAEKGLDAYVKHIGLIYKEIAEQTVSGERLEETEYNVKSFCNYYIDASNNDNYQYAYKVFKKQLSDGKHRWAIFQMTMAYYLGKNKLGHIVYKIPLRIKYWIQRGERFLLTLTITSN